MAGVVLRNPGRRLARRPARGKRYLVGGSGSRGLSLGRVVPAPHTRHLLGLFAAIAQNSLLRSFSIVDSLASRQHSCRGSEELAIRKTARFQATPNYSELLRVGGAQELRATPSYSKLLRATPSYSELLRATPSGYSELLELSELE